MMDRIFLTRDEVKHLTGTADRSKQAECLRENKIAYTLDVFGRPVVTIAAVEGSRARAMATDEPDGRDGYRPSWLETA